MSKKLPVHILSSEHRGDSFVLAINGSGITSRQSESHRASVNTVTVVLDFGTTYCPRYVNVLYRIIFGEHAVR